ncbi:MAG: four helix bundle protein [Ignavibacteriaceae bacterium]
MYKNDLNERLFNFAVDTILFLQKIKNTPESKIIKYQLTKSSTSSGANYEESQAASSRADFSNKIKIFLKEMRESNYWFRVLCETKLGDQNECKGFIEESEELKKILGAISSKLKN